MIEAMHPNRQEEATEIKEEQVIVGDQVLLAVVECSEQTSTKMSGFESPCLMMFSMVIAILFNP